MISRAHWCSLSVTPKVLSSEMLCIFLQTGGSTAAFPIAPISEVTVLFIGAIYTFTPTGFGSGFLLETSLPFPAEVFYRLPQTFFLLLIYATYPINQPVLFG